MAVTFGKFYNMNIGFWNINDKRLDGLIKKFVEANQLDILILGESPYPPAEMLLVLNETSNLFYFAPTVNCKKIQFFTKFNPDFFSVLEDNARVCARKLISAKFGDIILIAAHYNSKVNWANEDQAAHSPTFKSLIDSVETAAGHSRTIVCGDFNMNPFDFGMVQTTGLHAVMEKRTAQRQFRTVDGIQYPFFYNPMWGFLGDNGKGAVSGTMYFSPSKPINYHWNLFDQVLIRPALLSSFDDDELDIVTNIEGTSLLTSDHHISSVASDHLPIKFKIDI